MKVVYRAWLLGERMIGGIVGMIARTLITASVDQNGPSGRTQKRAYYNWVIIAVACLPLLIFGFLFIGGVSNTMNGAEGGVLVMLAALAMTAFFGALIVFRIVGREVVWDDQRLKFRWFGNEADLVWTDIEKVEIRPHRRNYARIRFRDGRTFGVSAQFSGCNALLRDLTLQGIPFCKWGTSEPLPPTR